jgi:FkbM family methyltransferase
MYYLLVPIIRKLKTSIIFFFLLLKFFLRIVVESNSKYTDLRIAIKNLLNVLSELNSECVRNLRIILLVAEKNLEEGIKFIGSQRGQLGQDIFVLAATNFQHEGYFVEFGATNGVDLSNTFILERYLSWNGILAEPAKCWQDDLKRNRTVNIEFMCVWSESGLKMEFNETLSPELSTLVSFSDNDGHAATRERGINYAVDSISLNELLRKYHAPSEMEYLSIDTEGSEFEILNSLDFEVTNFKIITCEHNGTSNRDKIYDLLTAKGYIRLLTSFSMFDDWYVNPITLKNQRIKLLVKAE